MAIPNSRNVQYSTGDVIVFFKNKNRFRTGLEEVDDLHQRTKEGIETARLNGKQIGGVTGKPRIPKMKAHAKEEIVRLSKDFEGGLSDGGCIKLIGIHRNTYYKLRRNLSRNT